METLTIARRLLCGAAAAFAVAAASPAHAIVTEGEASASALHLDVLNGAIVAGPVVQSAVSGNAADSDSALSLTLTPILSTGILNTSASSNVDGSAGSKTASAFASIVDFDLAVASLTSILPSTALGLSFDLLTSTSTVSGDAGSFSALGTSNIVGLTGSGVLSALGSVTITGDPNQVLLDVAGISVIANRQSSSCTAFECAITTDALFVDVAGLAELTLSTSTAHLTAVIPEPSTYVLMALGLLGIIGLTRRQGNLVQGPTFA